MGSQTFRSSRQGTWILRMLCAGNALLLPMQFSAVRARAVTFDGITAGCSSGGIDDAVAGCSNRLARTFHADTSAHVRSDGEADSTRSGTAICKETRTDQADASNPLRAAFRDTALTASASGPTDRTPRRSRFAEFEIK
ncbi:MAG: hypothetical protein ACKOPG_10355 [Novosphingobium sp.]